MASSRVSAGTAYTHPVGTSPWDALHGEYDYRVEDIGGELPKGLAGALYRIGPGRLEVEGRPLGHIFDGDGMVSRFEIGPEGVGFRNRYVRTRHHRNSADGTIGRGIGTLRPGGFLANAFRLPSNVSNTNVVAHAGGLFSLWEGGRPHRLDPETLATIGIEDFDGTLKLLGAFSAHPKIDPHSGEMFNFGIELFPRPMIRCYRRLPSGRMDQINTFPLARPTFCHDFALTERHMVFIVDPIVVHRPVRAALGLASIDRCMTFDESLGSRVAVVPRDGGPARVFDTTALFHFHANNAFDDGDDVVLEIVSHDVEERGWAGWNQHLREYRDNSGGAFGGRLERVRISGTSLRREPVMDLGCEFPQIDHRYESRDHTLSFVAAASEAGGDPDSIVVCDHLRGDQRAHTVVGGNSVCEPIFVADPARDGEGVGWLLSVEHQPAQANSRLIVLDTERVADGPIATAELSHHLPMGFHGTFVPA